MKRALLGFSIFLVALAIGLVVPAMRATCLDAVSPPSAERMTSIEANPAQEVLLAKDDNLVAEFRDLPNIEDIDWSTLKADLVDTQEYDSEYREGEIIAKSGETWLGLFGESGKSELRAENLEVILHHRSTDPDNGDWFRFRFKRGKRPVFLTRKTKLLSAGPVNSFFLKPSMKSLHRGYKESFWLNDKEYTLRVTSGLTVDGSEVNVLVLETPDSSQIVTYNSYFTDPSTIYNRISDLLWVGDLDRDGKLDFYLSDFAYEKGGFSSTLFLSSAAEKGQLVKLFASFGTSGC